MANWISSKLKVAETFFEQIDQQAADSLKKNELKSVQSVDQKFNVATKEAAALDKTVSLKDQFKKKSNFNNNSSSSNVNVEYIGKSNTDPIVTSKLSIDSVIRKNDNVNVSNSIGVMEIGNVSKPKSTLTDSDWTELLSSTPQVTPSMNNGLLSGVQGFRKDVRRQRNDGYVSSSGSSVKNSCRSSLKNKVDGGGGVKVDKRLGGSGKLNGKQGDGNGKVTDREEVGGENNKGIGRSKEELLSEEGILQAVNNASLSSKKVDLVSVVNKGVGSVYDRLTTPVKEKDKSSAAATSAASGGSVTEDLLKTNLSTDGESDSDSDSASTSDSDSERERERRERREKILAAKAAAKAVEAIKERENMLARLEGEKESLEKILEERAKQQAQEASELQTTAMETMEAVELEKQKHNNTRMEALARLATLETSNADLARSLASAQKNLEMEINRVAELRREIELKETAHEELRRKIKTHHNKSYVNQSATKGDEIEREMLEAEYSFLTDKITILEDKAKKLEENIEMTRKDIEDPTEVETELKQRLAQLTDHLIQKQAQVETLSSEKATFLLRTEAVSRLLDESGSNSRDLESGTLEMPDSKIRPLFDEKIRSGRKHLGSLIKQLDAIFVAGAVFVRRNPAAKLWSIVYLVLLHFWVIYIFLAHTSVSDEAASGAAVSMVNINHTAGV